MKITRFEDLDCWQEARKLVRHVYEAIDRNPSWKRDIRLCGQIQAASVSVMFLFIAMSSAAETQSHLYVAVDQKYLSQESFDEIYAQAEKTGKMISGLIKYLRTATRRTRPSRQTE
jgi:23S rRNA-intervening sequence protein